MAQGFKAENAKVLSGICRKRRNLSPDVKTEGRAALHQYP
jgi:hypothetical protein